MKLSRMVKNFYSNTERLFPLLFQHYNFYIFHILPRIERGELESLREIVLKFVCDSGIQN